MRRRNPEDKGCCKVIDMLAAAGFPVTIDNLGKVYVGYSETRRQPFVCVVKLGQDEIYREGDEKRAGLSLKQLIKERMEQYGEKKN